MRVEINGVENIRINLRDMKKLAGNGLDRGLVAVGLIVVADAKRFCPVDTGRLRSSIRSYAGKGQVTIADGTKYGIYQEMGFNSRGGKWVQNPFIIPAIEKNRNEIEQIIGQKIRAEIKIK